MKFFGKELKFNNNKVYHSGDKPTPNEIGAATGKTVSATTAATAQWYRIATSPAGISRCMGNFTIEATVSGKHSATNLIAGVNYGINPTIQQISHSDYSAAGITKARIVYHTTYNNNYAYLEVYQPTATATAINVSAVNLVGWTLVTPSTVGSIPSGYTSKEITLVNNKIVANIQGSVSGSAGSATKATQDSAGQQINTTYIKGLSVSGKTITYTKGDGTTGTITTQDTNTTYSVGTASALGLTKLYTGTGTATDGTMTQSAINTALNGKAAASHTHNYATINDSATATGTTWSSSKTQQEINTSYNTMTKRVEGLEEECYETFLNRNNGMMYGCIKFDPNATSSDLSAPTQLAHGLLGSYGNLKLLANTDYTDGSNGEYVQIAAARGLSPTTSQGITVYGSYATCFGKTISTEGHGHSLLSTKGTNTISSTSADTTANWGAQGHSVHWYTATGQLNNQPSQWGYILNLGNGTEVHQLWMTQASGDLYHRGGNASGWSGSWRTILDTSNFAGRTKINLNGKGFTINGSAPSGPATGDIWVQI